jgi:hypothetical protein
MEEKNKKYRIHAKVHNSDYNRDCELRYVIQKRGIFFWWNISNELDTEKEAKEMCDKLNGYNCENE